MADTDDLIRQAAVADTTDQLDAIQAASTDPAVAQAVQLRRDELNTRSVTSPSSRRQAASVDSNTGLGPNMTTDPPKPKDHYFEVSNGDGTFRKVNAYGEEKGSPEDKKRFA